MRVALDAHVAEILAEEVRHITCREPKSLLTVHSKAVSVAEIASHTKVNPQKLGRV